MSTDLWRAPSPIIETHCHLDYLKQMTVDEIVAKSAEQNIEKIITIAVSPENYDQVIEIANKIPNVYCTQGTHPHYANSFTADAKTILINNLNINKKIVPCKSWRYSRSCCRETESSRRERQGA